MKIGPFIIARVKTDRHAFIRAFMIKLLSTDPELRAIIARGSRSVAKDYMQDVSEAMGLPFGTTPFPGESYEAFLLRTYKTPTTPPAPATSASSPTTGGSS